MKRRYPGMNPNDPIGKFILGGIGLITAGIGISVLVFLWSEPFGDFGSPPLFFRFFGSFIALAFVLLGGASFIGAFKVRTWKIPQDISEQDEYPSESDLPDPSTSLHLACPRCGAPLAEDAEVSPHGDVKCTYCQAWFNVHSPG
jgi:hypothetical protein